MSKHRSSRFRRLKHAVRHWFRHNRVLVIAGAAALGLLLLGGFWFLSDQPGQTDETLTASHQVDVGSGYRDISYKGRHYRYNNRITCILYAGIDSEGDITPMASYTFAPRADSISLIVMDEYHHKMTVISLSRDTMTEIHRFTLNGRDRGIFEDHLGYAFTYGNGGEASCRNLCQAVSDLLYGVPVLDYIVSNRSSLPVVAELVGSVSVTVPNDDLADIGFAAGQTVTIDGGNLEAFIRSRDTQEDFSNTGRMERQKAYISAAMGHLRGTLDASSADVWEKLEAARAGLLTNITRNRYLDLINVMRNTTFSPENYYSPEGTQKTDRYDEFYPDEDALLAKVIELFYLPL